MRIKLTPAFCKEATAELGKERSVYWDTELRGFGLVVTRNSARSYCVQYKIHGRSRRMAISTVLNLLDARKQAKVLLGDVARGLDPLAEKRRRAQVGKNTLRAVADEFFAREGKAMRTAAQRKATFERLIFPRLGQRPIAEIRRSEIIRLLDAIEDQRGVAMADSVLMMLRRLFTWHGARDDDFRSPIVRGMRRTSATARDRVLTDDELRALWKAAERRADVFGYMVRFLLLMACRRNEAAEMKRSELDGADWTIPAARAKGGRPVLLPLSRKARALLDEMPNLGEWVFTANGQHPYLSFTYGKRLLDEACGVTGYTIHDLRRTARSLMSRAGISADVAERCLAHVIGGVRGVYDRHSFYAEKKQAFEALATLVERIVNPPAANVRALRRRTP